MPFVDLEPLPLGTPRTTPKNFAVTPGAVDVDMGSDAPDRPSWSSTFGAAFRQDNSTVSWARSAAAPINYDDPLINPWDRIKGTPDEKYWESFVDVHTEGEFTARKQRIAQEEEDRKILAAAPWYQSLPTQMIAGTLDWPSLLPGGAFVRGAKGGFSVARSALNVGVAGGVAATAQEAVLQGTQELRTAGESAVNIGASVLLSGLLGAGVSKLLTNVEWNRAVQAVEAEAAGLQRGITDGPQLTKEEFAARIKATEEARAAFVASFSEQFAERSGFKIDLNNGRVVLASRSTEPGPEYRATSFEGNEPTGHVNFSSFDDLAKYMYDRQREAARNIGASSGVPGSLGAAANEPATLQGNTIAGKAAGAVAAATARLNPALRLLQSPSPVAREIAGQTFENSLYLKKNFEGVASEAAVETLMKEWNAGLASAIRATNDSYPEYRKAGGQLNREGFREAVGRAMRRLDDDENPTVAKVAKAWRSNIFDPLKEAAIKTGLLPEDVTVETAASYFSRMWNRNKLIAREPEFKNIVQEWVAQNSPTWAKQYDQAAERRLNPLRREIDDLEMAKLRRGEERKAREQGGEIEAGEFTEADIRTALRIVEGGAPKPKGVKTLTQFLHDQGGLVDVGGELAHMGINNRTRPGFIRKERDRFAQGPRAGGMGLDIAAHRAWEAGYFPEHIEAPHTNAFLDALADDFNKRRAVVRADDKDAYRLQELIDQLDQDLNRVGATAGQRNRFATSEEVKGIVDRVFRAMDAEADKKVADLKRTLMQRENDILNEREARFVGDPKELGRSIADEVFDTLTGKTADGVRPEFIKLKSRGPLKERTFNIPDALVEEFLENDVEKVGRRYTRIMGADVELAHKFGTPDMEDQLAKVREDFKRLRDGVTNEKELTRLGDQESAAIRDLKGLRDLLRGVPMDHPLEGKFNRITRAFNHLNYIRSMGEVVLASLMDAVRPAMVHGLSQYMATTAQLATNIKGIKASVREAQLAGSVAERVLGSRLATLSEIVDPYASRGPVEAFLENMTNTASKWNGIRMWTDWMKSVASVMTQDRILSGVAKFDGLKPQERAYLAYLGIDQSAAERIAGHFAKHGEDIDGVRVANTEEWTKGLSGPELAGAMADVRKYRAAINKDVDSIIVTKSVADVPLFASTPTGRAMLQFKTFALASHQRVLLRGLQEDRARFVGGLIAMTAMGMFVTWAKSVSGNREDRTQKFAENPGWWIAEGLDRTGVLSVPMELSNVFEKMTGLNPIKSPVRAFDQGSAISQKNQNRNLLGSIIGPTGGMIEDIGVTAGIPKTALDPDKDITQGQKNAAERLLPFNSYLGMRQMLRYLVNERE